MKQIVKIELILATLFCTLSTNSYSQFIYREEEPYKDDYYHYSLSSTGGDILSTPETDSIYIKYEQTVNSYSQQEANKIQHLSSSNYAVNKAKIIAHYDELATNTTLQYWAKMFDIGGGDYGILRNDIRSEFQKSVSPSRGEFETETDYENRIKATPIDSIYSSILKEKINRSILYPAWWIRYTSNMSTDCLVLLGKYDIDNQTFGVTFSYFSDREDMKDTFYMKVPRQIAQKFYLKYLQSGTIEGTPIPIKAAFQNNYLTYLKILILFNDDENLEPRYFDDKSLNPTYDEEVVAYGNLIEANFGINKNDNTFETKITLPPEVKNLNDIPNLTEIPEGKFYLIIEAKKTSVPNKPLNFSYSDLGIKIP